MNRSTIPPELLRAMYTWTGDPARRMDRVYRVTGTRVSRYTATDGHRYVSLSMPADASVSEGSYAVAPDGTEAECDPPPCCSARFLSDTLCQRAEPAGEWSFNARYVGAIEGIEKALAAYTWRTDPGPARETAKAKGARKIASANRCLASFTLAGEMDPMVATAHGGDCSVTMLIMPRRARAVARRVQRLRST